MNVKHVVLVAGAVAGLALVGCEKKNPVAAAADATKAAANKATDAAAKTVDAAKDAGAKTMDATKDAAGKMVDGAKDAGAKAVEGAKDAAAGATDAAAKTMAAMKDQGTKWLTDTVDKQWPGMKTQLEGYAKKVGDIKDAANKTKAEGLVKDLQGQIPAVEKIVGDLKNFKTGDFGSLFDQAKKAWDGFGSKLGDLKKLIPA